MCDYIIRHYWSEKTKSATLEPKWLTSGEELTKEQQGIKELYAKTIGNSTYYNRLSHTKLAEEIIDDFSIKYTYNDKFDPLGKDSSARGVTDIEMCISKKSTKQSRLILISLIFIIIAVMYLLVSKSIIDNEPEAISNILTIAEKNISSTPVPIKTEMSRERKLQNKICANEELNVKLADKKCWQFYVKDRCDDKTKLSYILWIEHKGNKKSECQGVTRYSDDDFSEMEIIKKDKKMPTEIKNFFKGVESE